MFQMLQEDGFTYDSTMPTLQYGYMNMENGIWPSEDDPMEVYDMLKKNFERAYYGKTRAPLGYFVHAAWWASEELEWRFEGFKMWMEEMMTNYDDVWVVPVRAGIEYMKNPVEKG